MRPFDSRRHLHTPTALICLSLLVALIGGHAERADAASQISRVSWLIINSPSGLGADGLDLYQDDDERDSNTGQFVSFGLAAGEAPGVGGARGPIHARTAFAEIDGRRLRAYAEVELSGASCDVNGMADGNCGVSSGDVLWTIRTEAKAQVSIGDDILIDGGSALDGLSGILQVPVLLQGRMFAEQNETGIASALLQTSVTGRTETAPADVLIDQVQTVNVNFVFGEEARFGYTLTATASHLGQVNDPADSMRAISDFGNTAVIGQVTRALVDTDGDGRLEVLSTEGFTIDSELGIDYLSAPAPIPEPIGLALVLLACGAAVASRRP